MSRTRVKWDNIAIALVGTSVAIGAAVYIVFGMSSDATTTPQRPAPAAKSDSMPQAPPATKIEEPMTLDEATAIVDEARGLMSQAQWTEAADRLTYVDEGLRDASGSTALTAKLEITRARWDALIIRVDEQIAAKQWPQAKASITSLLAIATVPDVVERGAVVDAALGLVQQAGAKPAADAKKPAKKPTEKPDKPVSGGGATTPKPTTSQPAAATHTPVKPAAAKPAPKPAATPAKPGAVTPAKPAATSPSPSTSPSIEDMLNGGVNLSPAQLAALQQQLEAALNQG